MDEGNFPEMSDIIPLECKENNPEDYVETCEDEVNDIVPVLGRLCINDNELRNLQPGISADSIPSSSNFEQASLADSNLEVISIFVDNMLDSVWLNEGIKAAVGNQKSLFGTQLGHSKNKQDLINYQDDFQKVSKDIEIPMLNSKENKILNITEETNAKGLEIASIQEPLNLTLNHNSEEVKYFDPETGEMVETNTFHKDASSYNSIEKSLDCIQEPLNLTVNSNSEGYIDPKTSEMVEKSNIIHQDATEKSLDNSNYEMDNYVISDLDSTKPLNTVDNQSDGSSGILFDSPPSFLQNVAEETSSAKNKRSRKMAVFEPPVPEMIDIRNRRFGIFQPTLNPIVTLKTNSSSDEDLKNTDSIGEQDTRNSRRRCKKHVKSLPRSITLNPTIVEERRPSPCKRKNTSSENVAETTEKFRKRSISEHNSETGENTHLVIRSRSLSSGLKNIQSDISGKSPPPENSKTSLSRKRTNSFSHYGNRVKQRKSSSSSDDTEQ